MKFIEAVSKKSEIGETIIVKGDSLKVFIAPNNPKDFEKYLVDFDSTKFNNESAIPYSKDEDYKVCAIWSDGIHRMSKDLFR
jgi:hypothetical protein